MFKITDQHTVYLYPGVTDFRLGIYGLRKLIGNEAKPGSIYIFANKTLNAIKVIEIEANAVWLYQRNCIVASFHIHEPVMFLHSQMTKLTTLLKVFPSSTRLKQTAKLSPANFTNFP